MKWVSDVIADSDELFNSMVEILFGAKETMLPGQEYRGILIRSIDEHGEGDV